MHQELLLLPVPSTLYEPLAGRERFELEGAMSTNINSGPFSRARRSASLAFIDDDLLSRAGAREILNSHRSVASLREHTLEESLGRDVRYWAEFDAIVVDVHDAAKETNETGTDVYSGVALIESIRRCGNRVRIVAIVPSRNNPLLWERLTRAGADYVYERVEFQRSGDLVGAIVEPNARFQPRSFPRSILIAEGLGDRANPNRAMEIFKQSPLYGSVNGNITLAATGPRREVLRLRDAIIATGFIGAGQSVRWNEVRDYLLKLAGRLPVEPCHYPYPPLDDQHYVA